MASQSPRYFASVKSRVILTPSIHLLQPEIPKLDGMDGTGPGSVIRGRQQVVDHEQPDFQGELLSLSVRSFQALRGIHSSRNLINRRCAGANGVLTTERIHPVCKE